MNMTIEPFKACGPISCCDSYASIKNRFADHSEFRKSPFSKHVTSSILNDCVHVYYREDGSCDGVEVFKRVDLEFEGVHFFQSLLKSVTEQLTARGIPYAVDDYGISVDILGIKTYSSDFVDDLTCRIDAVSVSFKPE